jgi:hypothetical protein
LVGRRDKNGLLLKPGSIVVSSEIKERFFTAGAKPAAVQNDRQTIIW